MSILLARRARSCVLKTERRVSMRDRPIKEKIDEFVQAEAEALLSRCSPEAQQRAHKIMDAAKATGRRVDWMSMHDLALRTIQKSRAEQENTEGKS